MLFSDIPTEQHLEYRLYLSLKISPCRCRQRWHKPTPDNSSDIERLTTCSRCAAIKEYETKYPDRVPAP